jgi:hypothetical protein
MSFIKHINGDPMEPADTLRLTLVHAAADAAAFSPGYQGELRQFYQLVRASGIRMSAVAFTLAGVAGDRGLTGEFVVPLAQEIGPVLARAALAWRQARAGRLVRLTLGGLDVEAGTPEDIGALLARAQALKAVHEGKSDEA